MNQPLSPGLTWRDLDDDARERAYSPSSCVGGNYQPFIDVYARRSQAARARIPGGLGLRYGPLPAHCLDLFMPPGRPATTMAPRPPLLVFIHGGYWQALSRQESAFAAEHCVSQGIALAAIDYTLAPQATLAEMVDECRAAIAWLQRHADRLGFDAARIAVAGSSAGAHLAAMVATAALPVPATPAAGLSNPVKAAVLVSGIYELEPLLGTSINAAVGLTPASAQALSPAFFALSGFPPSIVCWGQVETAEFKRQSLDFAGRLAHAGTPCQAFEVPQRNHFDVILDLADPATKLGQAVVSLMHSL